LSLDSFDNDPFLFWTYVAAAVNGTGEMPDGGTLDTLMIRPGRHRGRATHHRRAG
jgi:hypothetical protein